MAGEWIDPQEAAARFPHLFREVVWPWGPVEAVFELFLYGEPSQELISNANLVPLCGADWLILRLADGNWEIPGGTLEPGESYPGALARELMEEAGAEILSVDLLGGWRCHSLAKAPHRPYLPFPEFYRLVAVGEVSLLGPPENPVGGEKVECVMCLPLDEVVDHFRKQGRDELAELYALARLYIENNHGLR